MSAGAGEPATGNSHPRVGTYRPLVRRFEMSSLARSADFFLIARGAKSPTLLLLPSWIPKEKSGAQRPIRMPVVRERGTLCGGGDGRGWAWHAVWIGSWR